MTKTQSHCLSRSATVASMALLFCLATAAASPAQTALTTLVNFDGANGGSPSAALMQGFDGNFYGTTYAGGVSDHCNFGAGCGTVFKMTQGGALTTLYIFCSRTDCADGGSPFGSLVQGANGDFYGTTSVGGAYFTETAPGGTVFKITPAGKITVLYSFCALANCEDGSVPFAGLVQGRNGNFYGTTSEGGSNVCIGGCGTVFEITPTGALRTLYSFCTLSDCSDGGEPLAPLVQGTDGNLYGETLEGGGELSEGTTFKITPGGDLTTLLAFDGTNGKWPLGGLIQASDGNFYGVTELLGGNRAGTVFKVTPNGNLTTLYNFCSLPSCADGASPVAPLDQGSDGNFYGTTAEGGANGQGTAFEITPAGVLTTLYSFCSLPGCSDGLTPQAGLLQDTNGTFYGTTIQGGADGDGTIFSLNNVLGSFVAFVRPGAKVGQTGGILGQGFTGTSSVVLNGVPAAFTVVSDTFIEATIPEGAKTGYVTVTTPTGTLTSNVPFYVIP